MKNYRLQKNISFFLTLSLTALVFITCTSSTSEPIKLGENISREQAIFVIRHCEDIDPPFPNNNGKGYNYILPSKKTINVPHIRLSQPGLKKADLIGKVLSKWINDNTNFLPIGQVTTQNPLGSSTTQNPFCTAFPTINPGILPGFTHQNPNPNPNKSPDPNQPTYPDMAKLPTKVNFFNGIKDLKEAMTKDFTGTLFVDSNHSTFVTMTRQTLFSPCSSSDKTCTDTKKHTLDTSLFLGTLTNSSDFDKIVYPLKGKTLYIFSKINISSKKFDKLEVFSINDDGTITSN
ncbi:hypothetical protein [uncultured Tenacibaculum sp.]|uniref:hypothetical protein n=1 Tax=uncultured Tenacibaculum sp. TaxID=174713 RepID=UPI002601B6BB|nr:hypothetical protein [uncultured Tenacibaculum sp.]